MSEIWDPEIDFLFKSNKGTSFNELKNIASGGEISRIMLSIKSILSKYRKLSAIIFDEIDTGISGSVSSKVGELMKFMAQNMQVMVITHTAQVASKGDFHFKVFKREHNDKIVTDIKSLSDKDRVNEIAEMLSFCYIFTYFMLENPIEITSWWLQMVNSQIEVSTILYYNLILL